MKDNEIKDFMEDFIAREILFNNEAILRQKLKLHTISINCDDADIDTLIKYMAKINAILDAILRKYKPELKALEIKYIDV